MCHHSSQASNHIQVKYQSYSRHTVSRIQTKLSVSITVELIVSFAAVAGGHAPTAERNRTLPKETRRSQASSVCGTNRLSSYFSSLVSVCLQQFLIVSLNIVVFRVSITDTPISKIIISVSIYGTAQQTCVCPCIGAR